MCFPSLDTDFVYRSLLFLCSVVDRNSVILTVEYNRTRLQRRECGDCDFLYFSPRVALYPVQKRAYLYVALPIFFFVKMNALFMVVDIFDSSTVDIKHNKMIKHCKHR